MGNSFTKEVYIDRSDFEEVPPPKFFRLKPDGEVRLMGSYIIKCNEIIKDADGKTGTFTMKYSGTNTPLTDHARMAYTSTRNYSIQDNVLGILSYAGKDGGRDTTLRAEGFNEADHSTVNWSHGTNTYQLFYYTFEFKD